MVRSNEHSGALRSQLQAFVRRFGLLGESETPCGQPLALSHAHALLVLLERHATEVTHQKDLAVALSLDKSSVARLCARMEEAGHVAQERSEADGRARKIVLTAKGARVARQVDESSRARFDRLLAAIPAAERSRVVEALALLNDATRTLAEERR